MAIGNIAQQFWNEIPHHFPFVRLGEFVVMPNHVHGIIIIQNPKNGAGNTNTDLGSQSVETLHATSLRPPNETSPILSPSSPLKNEYMSRISPKPNSLSTIIRSYKSAVSKSAHDAGFEFGWQSRFHDHIIKNNESLRRIEHYIINNPAQWIDDMFFI